jgi:hypothetical protein
MSQGKTLFYFKYTKVVLWISKIMGVTIVTIFNYPNEAIHFLLQKDFQKSIFFTRSLFLNYHLFGNGFGICYVKWAKSNEPR